MKLKCPFCGKDSLCGCHNDEPIYSNVDEHPQFDITSGKEFDDLLDELDTE